MNQMTPRVEAIKMSLDDKYPVGKTLWIHAVVDAVDELMQNFKLTADEMDSVVEITKQRLEDIMTHQDKYNKCSPVLGNIALYKQANGRTKTVMFWADHQHKKVDLMGGELLDSQQDYEDLHIMNTRMEEFGREAARKQAQSTRDLEDITFGENVA